MSNPVRNPGLDTLIEYGAVRPNNPGSKARNAIIDCIGCQLVKSEIGEIVVFAKEIATCSGIARGDISFTLERLERAQVLASDGRYLGGGRPVYYSIAETAVGNAFMEAVQPPEHCPSKIQESTQ